MSKGRAIAGVRFAGRPCTVRIKIIAHGAGEMAEWLKAHAWKACLLERVTWVRIPLSPPVFLRRFSYYRLQAAQSFLSNFSPNGHTLPWREHSRCVEPLGSFV